MRLLRAFAEAYPRASFVEIGANDGQRLDPLSAFVSTRPWHGVMVEPVPYVFERLRRNYADNERVSLENAAIAASEGSRRFYYLAEATGADAEQTPWWYDALGSFEREHVLRNAREIRGAEGRLREIDVPCMTLESLCRKHGISSLDLLLIDAEGYDWEIVRSIDLEARRPRLLVFEHHHLSTEERSDCERLLRSHGYELVPEGLDTWCVDTRPDDALSATVRRLAGSPGG